MSAVEQKGEEINLNNFGSNHRPIVEALIELAKKTPPLSKEQKEVGKRRFEDQVKKLRKKPQ